MRRATRVAKSVTHTCTFPGSYSAAAPSRWARLYSTGGGAATGGGGGAFWLGGFLLAVTRLRVGFFAGTFDDDGFLRAFLIDSRLARTVNLSPDWPSPAQLIQLTRSSIFLICNLHQATIAAAAARLWIVLTTPLEGLRARSVCPASYPPASLIIESA